MSTHAALNPRQSFATKLIYLVPLAISLVALAFISYGYFINWQIHYSSDLALIGLMAKYIAEHGERPIFVWSVGYQGMLVEGYLAALFFKLFGVSPSTLALAPISCLWLGLTLWTSSVWRLYNMRVASIAALFMVITVPLFYHLTTRTVPNFSSILMLSGISTSIAITLFKHYNERQTLYLPLLFFFGVTLGFSFYIFSISIYFFLTFFGVTALLLLRQYRNVQRPSQPYRELVAELTWRYLCPAKNWSQSAKVTKVIIWAFTILAWIAILVGGTFVMFFAPSTFEWGGKIHRSNALEILLYANLILVVIAFTSWSKEHLLVHLNRENLYRYTVFILGILCGYAPSLYYVFVLGGKSGSSGGVLGVFDHLVSRSGFFLTFHKEIFHFSSYSYLGWLIFSAAILLIIMFAALHIRTFFRARTTSLICRDQWRSDASMFFVVFPLVVFTLFIVVRKVVDLASTRYLVFLIPIYAIMISWTLDYLQQKRRLWRAFALLTAACLLTANAYSLKNNLKNPPVPESLALIDAMTRHQLHYAYGDYWLAYTTTFLSNEQIIIEPIYSNYSPHYAARVAAAQRFGYAVYRHSPYDPAVDAEILESLGANLIKEVVVTNRIVLYVFERGELD